MLFSEINTIVSDLTNSTTTSFPTATRLIYANQAQEQVSGLIIGTDGRWNWDDSNYTSLPIGTTDLVSGQRDYSFDDTFLKIKKVQILDSSGATQRLTSKDMKDYKDTFHSNEDAEGTPDYYDKDGRSVYLDPIPNYASSGGLKVFFQRTTKAITEFGSDSPGFYSPAHEILAYKISIPYCMKYHQDRVVTYTNKVLSLEESLVDFYSTRSDDEKFGQVVTQVTNTR